MARDLALVALDFELVNVDSCRLPITARKFGEGGPTTDKPSIWFIKVGLSDSPAVIGTAVGLLALERYEGDQEKLPMFHP